MVDFSIGWAGRYWTMEPLDSDNFVDEFPYDPARSSLWDVITDYLVQYVDFAGTIVDVGAGYCHLINNIEAERKIAIDLHNYPLTNRSENTEALQASATELPLEDNAADIVCSSNMLEHLPESSLQPAFEEFTRILSPTGSMVLIQPNYELVPDRYFAYDSHLSVLTTEKVKALLDEFGLELTHVEQRFLPFSTEGLLPTSSLLAKVYLQLPISPFAGQSLYIASPSSKEPNEMAHPSRASKAITTTG